MTLRKKYNILTRRRKNRVDLFLSDEELAILNALHKNRGLDVSSTLRTLLREALAAEDLREEYPLPLVALESDDLDE
jgi:hypothetical protein